MVRNLSLKMDTLPDNIFFQQSAANLPIVSSQINRMFHFTVYYQSQTQISYKRPALLYFSKIS
ncbi:hypothetical protein BH20BAC1_BH20BAC1_14700 [soil metagenome]